MYSEIKRILLTLMRFCQNADGGVRSGGELGE